MIFLGIDPSINKLGWSIIYKDHSNHFHLKDCGLIKTKKGNSPSKISEISAQLQKIFAFHKPTHLVIEECFVGKNINSALTLGLSRGCCMTIATQNNCDISEIHPVKLKKIITGKGSSSKEQVDFMVKTILNIDFDFVSADVSDATAIALSYAMHC